MLGESARVILILGYLQTGHKEPSGNVGTSSDDELK